MGIHSTRPSVIIRHWVQLHNIICDILPKNGMMLLLAPTDTAVYSCVTGRWDGLGTMQSNMEYETHCAGLGRGAPPHPLRHQISRENAH